MDITLRKTIYDAKAEYDQRHGPDWYWTDEGLPYAIQDYHSMVGSIMDFTEDDWLVCKENGWTLDEVCELCDEQGFETSVDTLSRYFQTLERYDEFFELGQDDLIGLLKDFLVWRKDLFPIVQKIYG